MTMTESNAPMRKTIRGKWLAAACTFALVVCMLAYWGWSVATRSETGIILMAGAPALLPSHRLAGNLTAGDNDVVRESLAILTDRKDSAGVPAALPLLRSKDPYVWLNAALYLGSMKRSESVPYLIKGLRHNAWRSHSDCGADLTAITGQTFGTDFQKWHGWWEMTHPSSGFDFDGSLGK